MALKKLILIILIVGMLGWAIYEYALDTSDDKTEESSENNGLSKNDKAPDFALKTLDGKQVKLSDYKGKRVIINFWATWCPPCRAEMPDLKKINEKEDVEVLGVDMYDSEKNKEEVENFVNKKKIDFPILMDEDSSIQSMYQVQAYPTSYMIDSDGKIQFIAIGAMNYDIMKKELSKIE